MLRATDRIDEVLEAEMPAKLLEVLGDGGDAAVETARRRGTLVPDEPIEQVLPPELIAIDLDEVGESGFASEPVVKFAAHEPGILDFGFDRTNPLAQRFAAERSAVMVQLTKAETRRAVRGMITRIIEEGFAKGRPPLKIARDIRPLVGLTWNQQNYVGNLRTRLARDAIDDVGALAQRSRRVTAFGGRMKYTVPPGGFPQPRIDAIANQYSQRLLRWRANNIARTETLRAANEGQRLLWVQAAEAGDLPGGAKRMWIVTPDIRLCPICQPMRGQVRSLTGLFTTGNGDLVLGPPAHQSCRCAVGITTGAGTGTSPTTQPRARRPTTRRPGPRRPTTPRPTPPAAEPAPPPPGAGGGATVIDIGPPPGPVPEAGRRYTFKEFGGVRPRIKARAELLDDALQQAMDSLPPNVRQMYLEVLEQLEYRWKVATSSTNSLGSWGLMESRITARTASLGQGPMPRRMTLQLSRRSEDSRAWILKQADEFKALREKFSAGDLSTSEFREAIEAWKVANPRPDWWRLANKDEVAEVIVHEMAHGIDVVAGNSKENWYGLTKRWNEDDMHTVWWQEGYWGGKADVIRTPDPRFADGLGRPIVKPHKGQKGDERFSYGTKKPTEAFAEAMRLYFSGDTGTLAKVDPMTAAEFRTRYPKIADWIKRVVINGE